MSIASSRSSRASAPSHSSSARRSPLARRSPSARRPQSARRWSPLVLAIVGAIALFGASTAGAAEAPVGLGTTTSFAVLAGGGITNTGATTITGDIGTFPTPSQTGFGTITQTGVNHADDAVTQQAKIDLVTAFDDAAGRGPATATVPVDLAGQRLTSGVYNSGTFALSGVLTLDFQGDPNAVFVFQAASTLITGSASRVNVVNAGTASVECNVYWKVGTSATLGAGSFLVGTVMAQDAITLNAAATVEGRVLARDASVTMINNTITNTGCASTTETPTPTDTTVPGTGGSDGGVAGDGSTNGADGTDGTGAGSGDGSGTGSGTPVGSRTPGDGTTTALAFTGSDWRIAVGGVSAITLGVMCVALSTTRRRAIR